MRSLLTRLAILGLVWLVTPGLAEASENVWHLLWAGHSAHATEAGPDHAPAGDEHGCSGTFHLCLCHQAPVSALGATPGPGSARRPACRVAHAPATELLEPHLPCPEHPPRV